MSRPAYKTWQTVLRGLELCCLGVIIALLMLSYRENARRRNLPEPGDDPVAEIETTFYGRSDAAHVVRTLRIEGEPVAEWLARHVENLEAAQRELR